MTKNRSYSSVSSEIFTLAFYTHLQFLHNLILTDATAHTYTHTHAQTPSLLTCSKDFAVNRSSLIASCQSETSSTIPSLDVDGYAGISVPWKTSKEV